MFLFLLSQASLVLHSIAVIVWIGGVFFVRAIFIPSLDGWEDTERFAVVARVLPVFFRLSWSAVVAVLLTGYSGMIFGYSDGSGDAGINMLVMQGGGWLLILVFFYLDIGPFRSFLRARAAGDMDRAAARMGLLRNAFSVALGIGLLTSAVGAIGSLWAS